jgi:hypothetical protein
LARRFMALSFLQPQNPYVFVSYRREDTNPVVGRITDRLIDHFGKARVFRDEDNLIYGRRYRISIAEALNRCDILLAIIGPRWAGSRGQLHVPTDLMRDEIETALGRSVVIIPVLIDDTALPAADELPESLRPLREFQAARIRTDRDFNAHMQQLIDTIEALTRFTPLQAFARAMQLHPIRAMALAGAAVCSALAIYVALGVWSDTPSQDDRPPFAAIQECNRTFAVRCAQTGGAFGSAEALNALKRCQNPRLIRSDDPSLQWKDIWTTNIYSYAPGGGGPGGGKDDDVLKVGGWGDWYFSLIQFSLPETSRRPQFVALALYSNESEGASMQINVDRLVNRWDFPKGGTLWWKDRPGQRAVTTAPLPAPKKQQWYIIDITSLAHDWIDRKSENFGLQIRPEHDFGSFVFFASSDAPDKGKIPRLILCN